MNNVFDQLVKSKIEVFVKEYSQLSRQAFSNEEGSLVHAGEFGSYREKQCAELLKPFLPARLAVGSGFVITENGKRSTQCDIIIYDKETMPIIENVEQRFFPVEAVVGVIEVKSKLSFSELKDALKKLARVKELRNDISTNSFIHNNHGGTAFDPKYHIRDQLATFLICEDIEANPRDLVEIKLRKAYESVDLSLYHNMILSINQGCYMYNDNNGMAIYHPYYDYNSPHKMEFIAPHKAGYDKEHILVFLNYLYMLIRDVSVMYIEITNYLGATRIKKAIIANDTIL